MLILCVCLTYITILNVQTAAAAVGQISESEDDDVTFPGVHAAGDQLPQGSDKTTTVLDKALVNFSPR